MKLTIDGTIDEIRQFLQGSWRTTAAVDLTTSTHAAALTRMTTSKSTHFTTEAIQRTTSNAETLHKVQLMMGVHENVFATANFSHENLTDTMDPNIKYYEFNKPITPDGVVGVARIFA